jgi:hypothetical protein
MRARAEPYAVEPVSPELALIDPQLARAHLAWLDRAAEQSNVVEAAERPGESPVEPVASPPEAVPVAAGNATLARWSTAAKLVAAASLAANGFLAAVVVARDDPAPGVQAAATAPAAEAALAASGISAQFSPPIPPLAPEASSPAATANAAARGMIEQRILSLVVSSPSGKLPQTLVDPKTGLPKNNLQAVCHDGRSGSQLCIVRPAHHRQGEGALVRYTPSSDGDGGTFTWSRYRTG